MTFATQSKFFRRAKAMAQEAFLPFQGADSRPVLTGIGVVTPVGNSVEALCAQAKSGQNAFRKIERFDTGWCETDLACAYAPWDDAKFNPSGLRRQWMDRAVWYLLDALDSALADAGIDLSAYDPERIGIVLGTSHSGLVTTEDLYWADLAGGLEDEDPRRVMAIPASHICAAVATAIGAKGVRRTISSACASSTGAMGAAAELIRSGQCDIVITGGTDTVSLAVTAGFNALCALAKDGCQPFAATPGITLGEGAGIFVIEALQGAIDRGGAVQAEVLGYALSGDAHHATAPDEDGDGIRRVLQAALADAGVSADEVDYLSAHGTGTDANDIAESRATAALFGTRVPLSTPKSIFGHTLGASGVIETALTLGMTGEGLIPPTMGHGDLRPGCEALDYVPGTARKAKVDTFVCNNYGFGGNNASVVLRRHATRAKPGSAPRVGSERVFISGASAVNALGQAGRDGLVALMQGGAAQGSYAVADDRLPAAFKRHVGRASPMVKYAVSATGEALADAGLDSSLNTETGLIYSVVTGAQRSTEKYMESVTLAGPGAASAQHFPHTTNNAPGGQVSIAWGLKGYNTTLCGASGGLGYAMELVGNARQSRVVAAAGDENSPMLERFYAHAGLLAKEPVAPFAGKVGINFGDGAAAVLFESGASLAARGAKPMAEVLAWAERNDATYAGIARSGDALIRAIDAVLAKAGIAAQAVDTVVAMGMGPGYFARAELRALEARVPGVTRLSPVGAGGYGPAHTPVALLAAAGALVDAGQSARVLVAGIDMTGVAFAALIGEAAQ